MTRSRGRSPATAGTLNSRTWFRILGSWLRRTMSFSAVGRGHRRSWSWPGTVPRICCAGSSRSGMDPGTPGCPGSSPPGIRSGTVTTWSASASMRCNAWRIPEAYARVPRRTLGGDGQIRPWTSGRSQPARQTLTIPGTSPGTMARPDASSDNSRPSSGAPGTDGVPVRPAGGRPRPEFPEKPRKRAAGGPRRISFPGTLRPAPVPSGRYVNRAVN